MGIIIVLRTDLPTMTDSSRATSTNSILNDANIMLGNFLQCHIFLTPDHNSLLVQSEKHTDWTILLPWHNKVAFHH